jgi:hypothetical protein
MQGMTLKQMAQERWYLVTERYQKLLKLGNLTPEQQHEFVKLSLEVHILKGEVPKSLWKMAAWPKQPKKA